MDTTTTATQPLLGAYVGHPAGGDEQSFLAIAGWLGRTPDLAMIFLNQSSWSAFDSSVQWSLDQWKGQEKLVVSVPLITDGADLATAATGAYDAHWLAAAQKIAAYDPSTIIRVGWEMNGNSWMPWSAASNPDAYVAAFRHLVDVFRSVSPNFKFDWTPNIGTEAIDPARVYPGDAYVDIIGMDVYEGTTWFAGQAPQQRWDWLMNQPNGLKWQADFAAAHGKQISFPEYASDFNDGFFVGHMADWIKSHNVAYHAWWNANDVFNGDLASHPANQQAYEAAWGAGAAPAPSPSPSPVPAASGTLVLHLAEDAWHGDAQFAVAVDGVQLGGPATVTASNAAGKTQDFAFTGNWGAGAHQVTVTFLNDAWGGTPATDRNLYLKGLSFAGQEHPEFTAQLLSNGSASVTVTAAAPAPSPAPAPVPTPTPTPAADTLVLHLSGDAWNGAPQFSVEVDGIRVAGPTGVTVAHGTGFQDFTYTGSFGAGPHTVAVHFLNDSWGGGPAADRNLYVGGIDFDGRHYAGQTAHNDADLGLAGLDPNAAEMLVNGTVTFAGVTGAAAPAPSPAPAPVPVPTVTPSPAPAPAPTPSADAAQPTPVEPRAYVAPDAGGLAHGGAGADDIFASSAGQTLIGGGGNDVFHLGSLLDVNVTVATGGSITTVDTWATNHALASGVDNLTAQGDYAHRLTGNSGSNWIVGGNGNDTLDGGGGNDVLQVGTGGNQLTGGAGRDTFLFSDKADHDNLIHDFVAGTDMIDLRGAAKAAGYTGSGPVGAWLQLVGNGAGGTSIMLDPGGTGGQPAHLLATIEHVAPSQLHAGTDYIWA
jgi:Ca2+-binding RTX toxin-like protein